VASIGHPHVSRSSDLVDGLLPSVDGVLDGVHASRKSVYYTIYIAFITLYICFEANTACCSTRGRAVPALPRCTNTVASHIEDTLLPAAAQTATR
jgi:hypothetical protein